MTWFACNHTAAQLRMKQLEDEYAAKMRAERLRPQAGMEERMALYRQEIEEQSKTEVTRQVRLFGAHTWHLMKCL